LMTARVPTVVSLLNHVALARLTGKVYHRKVSDLSILEDRRVTRTPRTVHRARNSARPPLRAIRWEGGGK
jgi:hypothetical protein